MNLVIVKYNAGNVQSVTNALHRLGVEPIVSDSEEVIRGADKVIFPGVGEASTAMNYLKQTGLDQVLPDLKQPVLGICLGMQVMCSYSEENDTPCMGIFEHKVLRFQPESHATKVPHMGWNLLENTQGTLFQEMPEKPYVYFVHSYFVEKGDFTVATADYILPYSAALQKDNFYATQFHPEKSSHTGAKILENFVRFA